MAGTARSEAHGAAIRLRRGVRSGLDGVFDILDSDGGSGREPLHGEKPALVFVPVLRAAIHRDWRRDTPVPYWAQKMAQNTVYAMTNRRILILTRWSRRTKTQSLHPSAEDLERTEQSDGSGDLVFLKRMGRDSDGDPTTEKIQFMGVPDVRRVESLLRETFFSEPKSALTSDTPQTDVMPAPKPPLSGEKNWYQSRDTLIP